MAPSTNPNNAKRTRRPERTWINPEVGLVLMDSSLTPIAFNWEAALILSYPERPVNKQQVSLRIPDAILEDLRLHGAEGPSPIVTPFQAGKRKYICQANILESARENLPEAPVVLLLQRHSSAPEAVYEVAAQFNLTEREREALEGISVGLSSKELAERMEISPNTVKSYLHLIMVKMGVATRAGIIAKILEHNPGSVGIHSYKPPAKPWSKAHEA